MRKRTKTSLNRIKETSFRKWFETYYTLKRLYGFTGGFPHHFWKYQFSCLLKRYKNQHIQFFEKKNRWLKFSIKFLWIRSYKTEFQQSNEQQGFFCYNFVPAMFHEFEYIEKSNSVKWSTNLKPLVSGHVCWYMAI